MAPTRSGRDKFSLGFLIVWIVVWLAMMLVVIWTMINALLEGDLQGALFMVVWVAAAGFGLYLALKNLRKTLLRGRKRNTWTPDAQWHDDMLQ